MVKTEETVDHCTEDTIKEKLWPYYEYYFGDRDKENRKHGHGQNHWSGAESLEWYNGRLFRNTMHGYGEYRWRYRGKPGTFVTYEGYFYANQMHGYGTMSYPDGKVFTGLFYNNVRWGPGIESQPSLNENVGLWYGTQLIRLTWRPPMQSIAPDLTSDISNGRSTAELQRVLLNTTPTTIGKINKALELLKQSGMNPKDAAEKWIQLYPKYCTDLKSYVCHVEQFENSYFTKNVERLERIEHVDLKEEPCQLSGEGSDDSTTFFAWNNNDHIVNMMQHCFRHQAQKKVLDISTVINGPRKIFKSAADHELDCRTLLMASYLGYLKHVSYFISEGNIHPEVADNQGNTALMYAVCGDQHRIIQFLIDSNVKLDSFNDSCCTPLGVAIMRYLCLTKDINTGDAMVRALLPPPTLPGFATTTEKTIFEWLIIRHIPNSATSMNNRLAEAHLFKTHSKMIPKISSTKKLRSFTVLKDQGHNHYRKSEVSKEQFEPLSIESIPNSGAKLYTSIIREFSIVMNDNFLVHTELNQIPYLFEVNDMVKEIEASDEESKKALEKNLKKAASKVFKETTKPSKDALYQLIENLSLDSIEKQKIKRLEAVSHTIHQLLAGGANPNLVRYPQSAVLMATVSDRPNLLYTLIQYGANVNDVYPQLFGYTALDVAISFPLSHIKLEIIETLLEAGAETNHRLKYSDDGLVEFTSPENPGPTLLHALLAKKAENDSDDDIRQEIIEMLLQYECDAIAQYKGRSPIDIAMSKDIKLFEIFIKSPKVNLNSIINEQNQTVLIKMFHLPFFRNMMHTDRLQILTNSLLYGADPLKKCQDGDKVYKNIFVFTNTVILELEATPKTANVAAAGGKTGKKDEKSKKPEKVVAAKSLLKAGTDDIEDYKQAVDLVKDCARLLLIRWIQGKLVDELVHVIHRYKHRHWNMITKEHKRAKQCGLWLTPERSLQIWNILKSTNRSIYSDNKTLKYLLYITQYYNNITTAKSLANVKMSSTEKDKIENEMNVLLRELKMLNNSMTKPIIKPELASKSEKFKVCFECILPLNEDNILCKSCKMILFCSLECLKKNTDRFNCHPCKSYLKITYFPESSIDASVNDLN